MQLYEHTGGVSRKFRDGLMKVRHLQVKSFAFVTQPEILFVASDGDVLQTAGFTAGKQCGLIELNSKLFEKWQTLQSRSKDLGQVVKKLASRAVETGQAE